MADLKKLVIERVKLIHQIKALKDTSGTDCEYQWAGVDDPVFGGKMLIEKRSHSCIQLAYDQYRELNQNNYCMEYSYEEVFENLGEPPCAHCIKVRENKKKRMKLRTKLGQINGCITKEGLRLIKNG